MSADPDLSVVIPVYNEEPNLPAPLRPALSRSSTGSAGRTR